MKKQRKNKFKGSRAEKIEFFKKFRMYQIFDEKKRHSKTYLESIDNIFLIFPKKYIKIIKIYQIKLKFERLKLFQNLVIKP